MKKRLTALLLAPVLCLCACGSPAPGASPAPAASQWADLQPTGSMELAYAEQFSVDYYENGLSLVTIAGSERCLVVPSEGTVPEGLDSDITVLQQPLDNIYLVATSAMDLFRQLDSLSAIRLSGTKARSWYIPEAVAAMEAGDILYAGKYNAPDYELILSENCDLSIQSTMIFHNPEVKEQLERFGIPVLVERSSYESHPLGRMEWIRLYGHLLGRQALADSYFADQCAKAESLNGLPGTGSTVAFFYITSAGTASVRRPGDYVPRMIELAGGEYVFSSLSAGDSAMSTINMTMEEFYAGARDADFIVYNSAIDGELQTVAQLLDKCPLLADFRAVQNGNVWCTGKNMFQESMGLGDMILDLHTMLTKGSDAPASLTYMHRLT